MIRQDLGVVVSRLEGVLPPPEIHERILPGTSPLVPIKLDDVRRNVAFYESNVAAWEDFARSPHAEIRTNAAAQLRDASDTLAAWLACLNLPVQVSYQIWSGWQKASVLLPEAEYDELAKAQKSKPVWLADPDRGRGWWWYLDWFWWSSNKNLGPGDVEALVRDRSTSRESVDEPTAIIPLPRELMEEIDDALRAASAFAVEEERLLHELDQAVGIEDDDDDSFDRVNAQLEALKSANEGIWDPVISALITLRDFQIDHDLHDENARRRSAQAAFAPGDFTVNVTGVSDLDEDTLGMTAGWYLEGRLGFDDGSSVLKRAEHVSKVTVLDGVSIDDAVHVKKMLILLGAIAEVVDSAEN